MPKSSNLKKSGKALAASLSRAEAALGLRHDASLDTSGRLARVQHVAAQEHGPIGAGRRAIAAVDAVTLRAAGIRLEAEPRDVVRHTPDGVTFGGGSR